MREPTKSRLPKVSLDVFADIVEGRHPCPTLMELAHLAQYRLREEGPAPIGAEDVRTHLRGCPDCGEHYRALRLLARAADRATDEALEREQAV